MGENVAPSPATIFPETPSGATRARNHRIGQRREALDRVIDKYAFQLSAALKTEAAPSRKQRRTLKQIYEEIQELGFEESRQGRGVREGMEGRGYLAGSIPPANKTSI